MPLVPSDVEILNPPPLIAQLVPGVMPAGAAPTPLYVTGVGLLPESIVQFDGAALETTYMGPFQLRAELLAPALASIGSHTVSVLNPPPGGGESQSLFFGVETLVPGSFPRITAFEPSFATAGTTGFTLAIRGSGFTPGIQAFWNGVLRATTYVHAGRLSVQVAASDVASVGSAAVVVRSPGTGGDSFVAGFPIVSAIPPTATAVVVPITVAHLVSDPVRDIVYATVPASAGQWANEVLALDPLDGEVLWHTPVGDDPRSIAVNEDGSRLYVALLGGARVARIALPAGAREVDLELGSATEQDLRVEDLAAIPGRPASVAVAVFTPLSSPRHRGVAVYDGDVLRNRGYTGTNRVEPSAWSTRLYGFESESSAFQFRKVRLGAEGVIVEKQTDAMTSGYATDILYDNGIIFSTNGDVFDPEALLSLGSFQPSEALRPDVAKGRLHSFTGTTLSTVQYSSFVWLGSIDLPEAAGAIVMARFGSDGLALGGGANVVFVRSDLIGP